MRVHLTVTIEEDIAKKVKQEPNQSHLINQLLIDYFKKKEFDGLSEEELKKEIKILKLQDKIKELRNED